MRNNLIKTALLTGVGVLIIGGGSVLATESEEGSTTKTEEQKRALLEEQQRLAAEKQRQKVAAAEAERQKLAQKQAANQTKLTEGKLRSCQARERNINRLMEKMATRGESHITRLAQVSTKVQQFYADKGNILSNYDSLLADVNSKKAAAEAAVAKVRADRASFKCDGTDPKGVASVFKEDLKAQTTAVKGYKTAVKNLIVGVKSVQGTTSSNKEDN